MPHRRHAIAVLLPCLLFGTQLSAQNAPQTSGATAQNADAPSQPAGTPAATTGAPPLSAEQLALLDVRASELIGKKVTNAQREDLGKIEDLILDVSNSRVRYAVVSHGGIVGIGSRLAAFPPMLFRPGREEGELVLNITREQLDQAPAFDEKKWPDWNDESYRSQVDRFFLRDDEVFRTPSGARLARASEVIGKGVNDGGSRSLGNMEDLVVNLGNGQIRYAVLKMGGTLGVGGRLVPLPMTAFRFPTRPDIAISLLLDRERVEQARAFDENKWPDLNEARQRRQVEGWLSQVPSGGSPEQGGGQQAPASGGNAEQGTGKSGAGPR